MNTVGIPKKLKFTIKLPHLQYEELINSLIPYGGFESKNITIYYPGEVYNHFGAISSKNVNVLDKNYFLVLGTLYSLDDDLFELSLTNGVVENIIEVCETLKLEYRSEVKPSLTDKLADIKNRIPKPTPEQEQVLVIAAKWRKEAWVQVKKDLTKMLETLNLNETDKNRKINYQEIVEDFIDATELYYLE